MNPGDIETIRLPLFVSVAAARTNPLIPEFTMDAPIHPGRAISERNPEVKTTTP